MQALNTSQPWRKLEQLAGETRGDRIGHYFQADPARFDKMSLRLGELLLDYSKNKISAPVMDALLELAEQSPLREQREKMFSGAAINVTENRPVLHVALRNCGDDPIVVDGRNVMPDVRGSLDKIRNFTQQVRTGEWLGCTGKRIRNVVNIGIGGSDLGPSMVCQALLDYQTPDLSVHFISNVDGRHLKNVLKGLDPGNHLVRGFHQDLLDSRNPSEC